MKRQHYVLIAALLAVLAGPALATAQLLRLGPLPLPLGLGNILTPLPTPPPQPAPSVSAGVFDICESPILDFRTDLISAIGVGVIFPGGTIPPGGVLDCSLVPANLRVGTFFQKGGISNILLGLRNARPDDLAYVDWQFRIESGDRLGAIDTTGPVKLTSPYPQSIIGATSFFRPLVSSDSSGEAQIDILDGVGFQFRITLPPLP
ncbi:MAG: hypothetical protein ACRERD_25630 [Candidatus Binatia bacterium]